MSGSHLHPRHLAGPIDPHITPHSTSHTPISPRRTTSSREQLERQLIDAALDNDVVKIYDLVRAKGVGVNCTPFVVSMNYRGAAHPMIHAGKNVLPIPSLHFHTSFGPLHSIMLLVRTINAPWRHLPT